MKTVIAEKHAALARARQVARFFVGLSSPATSRAKLTKHDAFGLCEQVPFGEVFDKAQVLIP